MDAASSISTVCEIILGLLLFFVSIVWLIFPFIVMGRMEKGNRMMLALLREIEKGNQLLANIAASTAQITVPPEPSDERAGLQISQNGEDLGQMDVARVKTMLRGGQLTLQDQYFDTELNEWVTLDRHPEFC